MNLSLSLENSILSVKPGSLQDWCLCLSSHRPAPLLNLWTVVKRAKRVRLPQGLSAPRSQRSRQAVVHSPPVTGCSFLAWALEGGQGAARLHGNLGTEPWRLPGHEAGLWHPGAWLQLPGPEPPVQGPLHCSGPGGAPLLLAPQGRTGLGAETYLEGMAGTIRGHWSKGSYVSRWGVGGVGGRGGSA